MRRYVKFLAFVAVGTVVGACAAHVKTTDGPILPSGPIIVVESTPDVAAMLPSPIIVEEPLVLGSVKPCDPYTVAHTPDPAFDAIALAIGTKEVRFTEIRNGHEEKLSEPVQEFGLRILDLLTCTTKTVIVTQEGARFTAPLGWDIQPRERSNGMRWNKPWSTDWKVLKPARRYVIEVRFPIAKGTGKSRTITYDHYYPYNPEFHDAAAVARGQAYNRQLVSDAFEELGALGVRSKAFPHLRVADVPHLKHEYFERLPVIEWTDFGEFLRDPRQTVEYFWIKVGNNGSAFGKHSRNFAGARGLVQFTNIRKNGTYAAVVKAFPSAKLTKDFTVGAHEHLNSMKMAILLHDLNLAAAIKKYGPGIADDPRLEEFLAAYYNAKPSSVDRSLKPALAKGIWEWTKKLPVETKEYIPKLRYVRDEYAPVSLVFVAPR